jgi:hypothetical protein
MFYRTVRVRTRDAVRVVGGYAEIICCVRQEVRGGIRVRRNTRRNNVVRRKHVFGISSYFNCLVNTHKRHVYRVYIAISIAAVDDETDESV